MSETPAERRHRQRMAINDAVARSEAPVVWHHGILSEVVGPPEQIADAVLAA